MLDSFPVSLAVGTALGFLSGLGVGGGSLLILWLTLVLQMESGTARSLNLLFFLPAAVVACLFRWKQGVLNFRQILPGIAGGCAAAILGTMLAPLAEPALARKLFGVLLMVTAVRELAYRKKTEG